MSRPRLTSLSARAVLTSCIALTAASAEAQSTTPLEITDATFQTIVHCLSAGDEIVMAPKVACVPRSTGDDTASAAHMPLGDDDWSGNWNEVCADKDDPRRLPANIIKRIVAHEAARPAPTGIRIIGAVFCPAGAESAALDLAGLDVPYSIVIDRSVVNGYLDARNLRVKGDFSFDDTVILDNLRLNRARIEGSVYGDRSFMDRLFVNDTQITGTWWHTDGVVFSSMQFVQANISGDLNLSNAAFANLLIQSNRIGGTLNLDETEARCAYHINASRLGYIAAHRAGFGAVRASDTTGPRSVDFAWWKRAIADTAKTRRILESPAVKKIGDQQVASITREDSTKVAQKGPIPIRGCGSQHLEFFVLDSTVEAAFCLTSFVWLGPKGDLPDETHPRSVVALDDTKIAGNLVIDLWDKAPSTVSQPRPGDRNYDLVREKHEFEAIGLSTAALIYDFDNAKPYFTHIDGLTFDRIHKAKLDCQKQSGTTLPARVELPSTDDVLDWLKKNAAHSSQPFMAFVTAFERAGTSATPLRVRQRTVELCDKTTQWLPFVARFCPGERFSSHPLLQSQDTPTQQQEAALWTTALDKLFSVTGELLALVFQWLLFLLADHGLRPAKVVWSVGIALLAFLGWFWFILQLVGFEPKDKGSQPSAAAPSVIWPITMLFLFDRMIPAYKIREEHYALAKIYRKANGAQIKAAQSPGGPALRPMHYLGRKILVLPGDDMDLRRVEKWLLVLRLLGVVFAVFLLAAINTLTSR